MKPIIGIITKPLSDFEYSDDIWIEDYVKDEFRDLVCKGGCIPIGILPPFQSQKYNTDESDTVLQNNLTEEERSDLDIMLGKCDGFILQGGLSGDYYEKYVAEYAVLKNVPIIGICAGFNMLARVAGCDIVSGKTLGIAEKFHNVYSKDFRHTIDIVKGSVLDNIFHTETMEVNSLHTYFLDNAFVEKYQTRIHVNATNMTMLENKHACHTVEAFTIENTRFAMGIKWHPEIMDEEHKRKLFERFFVECKLFTHYVKSN